MSQMVETEFKNILSHAEYVQLLQEFALTEAEAQTQHNLYFDTDTHALKHAGMGLRLRITADYAHVTLKARGASAYQMIETTDRLDLATGRTILETGSLTAIPNVDTVLQQRGIEASTLRVIGSFVTQRLETPYGENTLVFDACTFEHFNDYELEMETQLPVAEGVAVFTQFLSEHHIARRPSQRKIQRMQLTAPTYAL